MQKEELLNLLSPAAREAFDRARQLARARGGVLSPLHIVVALLEDSAVVSEQAAELLRSATEALLTRYPLPAESITIPKDTQAVIAAAGGMAHSEGARLSSPDHLLRAAFASAIVRDALGDPSQLERLQSFLSASKAQAQNVEATAFVARALTGSLKEYCADLAEEVRASSAHPFVGRERELTALLETLCRKLKNNPLLIGKPGVGKTALVSAVAARLCGGNVPARLRGKRILEVSRLRLLADAKFAGDLEERLKQLLADVKREGDVILFFDEIHTLLSAGGAGGTGDIANLLKSALSKGEITCIGATTLAEYYKYIARDEALARRFSTITIEEPSPDEARRILMETRSSFESYHGVEIEDDIIVLIVDMADRYLHSRSFPDKAFDLLDKAAAKATMAGLSRLTRESVKETLSETTGLPLEIMDEDPGERLERLEEFLNRAVPGQQRAARDVARVVRIAKLGLELRPERPDGVFLFVGPEGVGKHEMATALAKFLYGSSQKMIEFDMSQFTENWSISRLIGAEPGYVGYGDRSGLLSKAAEDNPHSVLYFRNVDVANAMVQQFLGEAFEQGRFTDATGSRVTLSNTTVVMSLSHMSETNKHAQVGFLASDETSAEHRTTSGLRATGSLRIRERGSGFGLVESLAATIDEVIEFQVLDRAATEKIIAEKLEALKCRLEAAQPVNIKMDSQFVAFFSERLRAERKSLAQLERILQEAIIIPFTDLHFDRHALAGARRGVSIFLEGGAVKFEAQGGGDQPSSK
ncbi:MAG TPA: ATP-dependent Clp protease ATP-binding subunit [Blastocatellia bacterium]|nr:ATP-dependent Clp protease ATP-binding subunit [Blastocatellia bacterium]